MTDNFNPYAAPVADQFGDAEGVRPMSLRQIWFSFEGRISRSTFWLKGILPLYGILFGFAVIYAVLISMAREAQLEVPSQELAVIGTIAFIVVGVLFAWIGLAVYVKRWHDRGKSGWWQLIGLVPYIGGLWIFIECGCMAGTPGPNQYGPDPLGESPHPYR